MKAEVISMRDVLEIFADYLEQNEDVEVVQSRKMGVFTIFDGSGVSDRSMLNVKEAPDPESLARQLIWMETSEYYYNSDNEDKEPWDCDENLLNSIYYKLEPHLSRLPLEWRNEADRFFSNPMEELE